MAVNPLDISDFSSFGSLGVGFVAGWFVRTLWGRFFAVVFSIRRLFRH